MLVTFLLLLFSPYKILVFKWGCTIFSLSLVFMNLAHLAGAALTRRSEPVSSPPGPLWHHPPSALRSECDDSLGWRGHVATRLETAVCSLPRTQPLGYSVQALRHRQGLQRAQGAGTPPSRTVRVCLRYRYTTFRCFTLLSKYYEK